MTSWTTTLAVGSRLRYEGEAHSRDWERICATAGVARGGSPKLIHARLWVYEKLTAGPLQAAPLALRTDDRSEHRYHSFALRLPALAGELLDEQARLILVNNRIDEPLEWSPPRHWVDVDRLPGAEPDAVDSERVNRLLRAGRGPRAVAKALGVSLEAVRLAVGRPLLAVDEAGT